MLGELCSFAAVATLGLVACGDVDRESATVAPPPSEPVATEESVAVAGDRSPAQDSWNADIAESFQVAAIGQLKAILKKLDGGVADAELSDLVVDPASAVTGSLRPADSLGRTVFEDGGIRVLRWGTPPSPADLTGLTAAYLDLKNSWPDGADQPRIKVKNFGINPDNASTGEVVTRTKFYAFAEGTTASVQQDGEWRCRWLRPESAGAVPRLLSVELVELEETRSNHGGDGALLADVTLPALGDLPAFHSILNRDANYWITRLPLLKHRFQHGISIGDVDGNGIEDIYLCQPEGLPNLLLLRQPDGSIREATATFGLDFRDNTTSALLADFDNDGDQDLAVAFRSPFDIYENVDGKFEPRFRLPHLGQIFSLAAADFDRDGLLDLYICRYQNIDERGRAPSAIPLHDAQNGGENALLKNLGDWEFSDVTDAVGLSQNNNRWSTAASWEDFDRDGDLDLYVSNDYGRNNLFRCDPAPDGSVRFSDIAAQAGVEDMTTSMGVSWGDPNRDGRPDIYVSNMYSSAGRRITFQKNFKRNIPNSDPAHVDAWQNASMGNSLFQSEADQTFTHTSEQARIQNGQWAWGSVFADINHDGWEDLLVANGFITGPSTAPDL